MSRSEEHRCLRIAFYGYAERDAGSVSSAGYVILRELLERGHQIDFFGKRTFAFPVGLDSYQNFRFVDAEGKAERIFGKLSERSKLLRLCTGPLTAGQTHRNIPKAIRNEHRKRFYDICFYFGIWAFGRVENLSTVSWVQGPPGTDSRSITRHASTIRRLEGLWRYFALRAFAIYRDTVGRPPFSYTNVVICGSEWAASDLRNYVPGNIRVEALPYPVNLQTFAPQKTARRRPTILWAGRSVPRKRLDLFLDACDYLLSNGYDIEVTVVGGFSFTPGYRKLIENFSYPDRLRYYANIPRAQMPDLYRRAAVLVQPSEDENFGSAIAEALACGTTVVLGPTNGTGDYIGDAGTRFLQYNSSDVADAIIKSLDMVSQEPTISSSRARCAATRFCDVAVIVTRLEIILHRYRKRQTDSGSNW